MNIPDPQHSRLETVLGAVLYLMTAYKRTSCPRIAACVAASRAGSAASAAVAASSLAPDHT